MKYLDKLIERKGSMLSIKNDIEKATNIIIDCFKNEKKFLVCGNGGSASDSAHIVGELMKSFCKKRNLGDGFLQELKKVSNDEKKFDFYKENLEQGLPCIDLTAFNSLNTAFANDSNAKLIFANSVLSLGKKDDVLLCITTSGNSENILYAAEVAKAKGIKTIALTGKDGGKIKDMVDVSIISKEKETYLIQEDHISIYHTMCLDIEDIIF